MSNGNGSNDWGKAAVSRIKILEQHDILGCRIGFDGSKPVFEFYKPEELVGLMNASGRDILEKLGILGCRFSFDHGKPTLEFFKPEEIA